MKFIFLILIILITSCQTSNQNYLPAFQSTPQNSVNINQTNNALTGNQTLNKHKLALVIGNSEYNTLPLTHLTNPVNDARAISASLKTLGFKVIYRENLTVDKFYTATEKFHKQLKQSGGTGLFYYAGHAIQLNGINYIVPLKANLSDVKEIKQEAFSVDNILLGMSKAKNDNNIVILDSCRNNPYSIGQEHLQELARASNRVAPKISRSLKFVNNGLAGMKASSNTYIAFATAPDSVASDGTGENGTFTRYLLKYMSQPGLDINSVFTKVKASVQKETNGFQQPWTQSSLNSDFYFVPPDKREDILWDKINLNTNNLNLLKNYQKKYPHGKYITQVQKEIDLLEEENRFNQEKSKFEKNKKRGGGRMLIGTF